MSCFFIHGWATTDKVWPASILDKDSYCYHSAQYPDFQHLVQTFSAVWSKHQAPLTVWGWSLGGMLALQLASVFPERIKKIVLISSTARFTSCDNYSSGLNPAIVKNLARKLSKDKRQAQLDFYRLMFAANESSFADQFINQIGLIMASIELAELQNGLKYLVETDLRSLLPNIETPCKILHGDEDTICPPTAAQYLATNLPHSKLFLLSGAGHIPFYTQQHLFHAYINEEFTQND